MVIIKCELNHADVHSVFQASLEVQGIEYDSKTLVEMTSVSYIY